MAKKDILLRAGVVFSPKDVDVKAIKNGIVKALADTKVNVASAVFGGTAKAQLQESFSKIQFKVQNAAFGGEGKKRLRESFRNTEFVIHNARFAASALSKLQKQIQTGVQPTVTPGGAAAGSKATSDAAKSQKDLASSAKQTTTELERQRQVFEADRNSTTAYNQAVTASEKAHLSFQKTVAQGRVNLEGFGANIAKITQRFGAYLVSLRLLFAAQQAFNQSINFIFKFDAALQDLQKVLQNLPVTLGEVSTRLFEVAQRTGNSVLQVADSFGIFVRQGGGVEQALKRTEAALVAVNVTELNVADSTRLITSVLNIFEGEIKDATQALDILSVTADNAGTTAGEIGRGVLRAGAAAEAVGVSFGQLNAIIAATEEATKLGGSQIGSALKTIFARLAANEGQLRTTANSFGAYIKAGDSAYTILQKLAQLFPSLNREQKAQLTQILAGKRRFTEFNAVLSSFDKTQTLVAEQFNAGGVAAAKNEVELGKLETRLTQVQVELSQFVALIAGIGEGSAGIGTIRQAFGGTLDVIRDVIGGINNLIKGAQESRQAFAFITGAVAGVLKVGLFKVGPAILAKIVAGAKAFLGIGQKITKAMAAVAGETTKTERESKKVVDRQTQVNQKLKEELTLRQRINRELARGSGRLQGVLTDPKFGLGGGRGAGKELAGGIGQNIKKLFTTFEGAGLLAVVALSGLANQMNSLAQTFRETGKAADIQKANMLEAAASGLEFGTTVGLLAGPIAGLTTAIVTASAQIIAAAVRRYAAETVAIEALQEFQGASLDATEAWAEGGSIMESVVKETGIANKEMGRMALATGTAAKIVDLLGDSVKRATNTLEELTTITSSATRRVDLQKEFRQAAEAFTKEALKIGFEIESGQVSREFGPLQNAFLETNVLLDRFIARGGEMAGVVTKITRLQAAVNEALAGSERSSKDILSSNLLSTDALEVQVDALTRAQKLVREQSLDLDVVEKNVAKATKGIQNQSKLLDNITKKDAERVSKGSDLEQQTREVRKLAEDQAAFQKDLAEAERLTGDLTNKRAQADAKIVAQKKAVSDLADQELKDAAKLIELLKAQEREAALLEVRLLQSTVQLQKQNALAEAGVKSRAQIALAETQSNRVITRGALQIAALREENARKVEEFRDKQLAGIALLRRVEEQAISSLGEKEAERFTKARQNAERASEGLVQEFARKLEIQVQLRLIDINKQRIEQAEAALQQFRLNNLDRLVEKERNITDRRLELIERLGGTEVGRNLLDKIVGRVGPLATRRFGEQGARISNELNRGLDKAVTGIRDKLAQLRAGAVNSFDQILGAEQQVIKASKELERLTAQGAKPEEIKKAGQALTVAKDKLEELSKNGVNAFELLSAAQQAEEQAVAAIQEKINRDRELVLKRVEDAAQRVVDAEKRLIDERNKIPALNAKIIQSQRNLAQAAKGVEDAQKNLTAANQNLADAQFKFGFGVELAGVKAGIAAGQFGSVNQAIGALAGAYQRSVNTVRASFGAILEARRELLQEELSLVQNQLSQIKGILIEAATAGPEQLAKLQESAAAAAAIAQGASVDQFSEDVLGGVGRFIGVVEGLEQALITQGAERLGLDPSVVSTLQQQTVELSRSIAETNQQQVLQGEEQVAAARASLEEARQQKDIAQQQLDNAIIAKENQLKVVAAAAQNAAVSRAGFQRVASNAERTLRAVNEGATISKETKENLEKIRKLREKANEDVKKLREQSIKNLEELANLKIDTTGIKENQALALGKLSEILGKNEEQRLAIADLVRVNAKGFGDIVAKLNELPGKIAASIPRTTVVQGGGGTGNRASGTLTDGEITSIILAARREKSAMPAGSRLVLANSSETILTRKQAGRLGLSSGPRPAGNVGTAQGGLVDTAIMTKFADGLQALNNSIANLNKAAGQPQEVNINVDSARRVTVQGLDGLEDSMKQALEARLGQAAQQAEVAAIGDAVRSIMENLKEGGNEGLGGI